MKRRSLPDRFFVINPETNEVEWRSIQDMNETERNWRLALQDITGFPNDPSRPICITPFEGRYGPAGYVIAVNGSPPHGIVFVIGWHGEQPTEIFLFASGKMRKINRYAIHAHYKNSKHANFWQTTINLLKHHLQGQP